MTAVTAATCTTPITAPALDSESAEALAGVFGSLADPARIKVVHRLASVAPEGVCVCDLIEPLGLTQPAVSYHSGCCCRPASCSANGAGSSRTTRSAGTRSAGSRCSSHPPAVPDAQPRAAARRRGRRDIRARLRRLRSDHGRRAHARPRPPRRRIQLRPGDHDHDQRTRAYLGGALQPGRDRRIRARTPLPRPLGAAVLGSATRGRNDGGVPPARLPGPHRRPGSDDTKRQRWPGAPVGGRADGLPHARDPGRCNGHARAGRSLPRLRSEPRSDSTRSSAARSPAPR